MKAVILAGGLGTRISEETNLKPKPMVEIGGMPIIWHIMKIYAFFGIKEFIICCGYKGYMIKEYFANYMLHSSDVTIDIGNNNINILKSRSENWKITLVDTGLNTMTGGRIKRVKQYVEKDKAFCLTYGDGLSNVNISNLIKFHLHQNKLATLTATYPPGRFGALNIEGDLVTNFVEKPKGDGAFINGGFFVLSPLIMDRINGDETVWEQEPLKSLADEGELGVFKHEGFWKPMDTLRDKNQLNEMWLNNNAPWKLW